MHAYPDDLEAFVRDHGSDDLGTRRRSACRLCKALPGSVVLVVSQDAGLRVVTYLDNRVICWEQLTAGILDI